MASKVDRITAKLRAMIASANLMTSAEDTTLTDAVNSLLKGYGSSGGSGAGVNAGLNAYKVQDGASVGVGDFVELTPLWGEGTVTEEMNKEVAVAPLSPSKALIVYEGPRGTSGNSVNIYAAIMSADGPSVTINRVTNLNGIRPNEISGLSATALSDNKALVVYTSFSGYMDVWLITFDGDTGTIYWSPANGVPANIVGYDPSITALTDSKALLVYRNNSSNGNAMALTVDGTTVTAGTALNIDTSFKNPKAVKMTDSKVLVAYETYDLTAGRAIVLSCPSTTVTKGSVYTFRNAASSDMALTALDQRRAVLVYRDAAATGYLYATVLQVSDATVTTQGSPSLQLTSYGGTKPTVTRIGTDTTLVVANFIGSSSEKSARAQVLTIGESKITKTELTLYTTTTQNELHAIVTTGEGSALLVSARETVVEYRGLNVDGTTVTPQTKGGTYVTPITSEKYPIGVARTAGEPGDSLYVYRSGLPGGSITDPSFTVYDGSVVIT